MTDKHIYNLAHKILNEIKYSPNTSLMPMAMMFARLELRLEALEGKGGEKKPAKTWMDDQEFLRWWLIYKTELKIEKNKPVAEDIVWAAWNASK